MTDNDLDFCHNSLSNKPGSNKTFMLFHTMNIHPRGIPIRHKAPCIIQDMVLRKCKLSTLLNAFKERSCTHRTSSSNHAYNVHNGVLEPGRQDGEHCSCPYFFCFSKVSEIRLGKPQTWTPQSRCSKRRSSTRTRLLCSSVGSARPKHSSPARVRNAQYQPAINSSSIQHFRRQHRPARIHDQ